MTNAPHILLSVSSYSILLCVRRVFPCGESFEHRQQWIENRLELLVTIESAYHYPEATHIK
jgi:hypothetical protein